MELYLHLLTRYLFYVVHDNRKRLSTGVRSYTGDDVFLRIVQKMLEM